MLKIVVLLLAAASAAPNGLPAKKDRVVVHRQVFPVEYLARTRLGAEVPVMDKEFVGPGYTLENLAQEEVTDSPVEGEQFAPEVKPVQNATEEKSEAASRVYSGTPVAIGQFPFVVYIKSQMLEENTTVECGGALISDNYVLTAAQCVASAASINVVAGDLDPIHTTGQTIPGIATVHPSFRKNFLVNDIALIKLLVPLTLGVEVYPVKLGKPGNPNALDLSTVRIFGWGTSEGKTSNELSYVDLMQLTKSTCHEQTLNHWIEFPATASCLSSTTGANGFCGADVGGPVTFTYPGEAATSLVGLMSQTVRCPSKYPMSYTRIGPYINWIRQNVKNLLKM